LPLMRQSLHRITNSKLLANPDAIDKKVQHSLKTNQTSSLNRTEL
jgi:hypothetical protein